MSSVNGPCRVWTSGVSSRFANAKAVKPEWSCTTSNGLPAAAAASIWSKPCAAWSASKIAIWIASGWARSSTGSTTAGDSEPGAANRVTAGRG